MRLYLLPLWGFIYSVCSLRVSLQPASTVGCISYHEAHKCMNHREAAKIGPQKKTMSIDLGYSVQPIVFDSKGLNSGDERLLATWDEIEDMTKKGAGCHALYDDGSKPWQISAMSEKTGFPASLCPPLLQAGAPTMVLGGFTMHRIAGENVNPMTDTAHKIDAVKKHIAPSARVLDTCMGLGYTAIAAARLLTGSGRLTTIEYDDVSIEMCKYNPWSKRLFDPALPIEMLMGDSCEIIKDYPDSYFNCIIHDPPARAICRTNLYSLSFYQQLYRVLTKPGGALFHYIGNPTSKESGTLYKGVKSRLQDAGFRNVYTVDSAFGLVAEC